jgi:hypothetical protein
MNDEARNSNDETNAWQIKIILVLENLLFVSSFEFRPSNLFRFFEVSFFEFSL